MGLFGKTGRFRDVAVGRNSHVSRHCEIGAHSYIGRNCSITRAQIGRYVSIADNVSIGSGEHDITRISTSSLFYEDPISVLTRGACVVGSDVWIGVDAIVRRGVQIGFGAVIGANSFVNRDVAPFAIVGGSPARVLGERFHPELRAAILESKWWELEPDAARKVISRLQAEHQARDA